jgi:hypothetical protein
MNDMAQAIIPKSDQLNSDDLIAGPITIQITGVNIKPGTEQPVAIAFAGDNGKPWKPCKSMSRVMVAAWGPDASKYAGRSLTLYREPAVKWAGMEVGGIRISHMSHIDKPLTMALTATKGSRKLFTAQPLEVAAVEDLAPLLKLFKDVTTQEDFSAAEAERAKMWKSLNRDDKATVKDASDNARAMLQTRIATETSGEPS